MAAFISIALFVSLVLLIGWIGYRHYARPGRFYDQLRSSVVAAAPASLPKEGSSLFGLMRRIGEQIPISPHDASITRRFLIGAGYRSDTAVPVYYGVKVVCCVCFLGLAFTFADYITVKPLLRLLLVGGAGIAGYFGPGVVLEHLVSRRQEALRFGLPDGLDLMVVCVEAGLGLDQAILTVSRELEIAHKEISEELRLVNLEMQAGKRRSEALRNLADRTGEPSLRQLTAVLIQTDRFGTSIAESLRTHADFMRMRRRQQAEERAAKLGIKIIFPVFFFILPTMFIVAVGPAMLQIAKEILPLFKSLGSGG